MVEIRPPAPDVVAAAPAEQRGRHRTQNRAGRNLPAAIAVGLGLGALVLVPLFAFRPVFVAVVVCFVAAGTYEMVRSMAAVPARPSLVPLVVGGATGLVLGYLSGDAQVLLVAVVLTSLAVLIWRQAGDPTGYANDGLTGVLIAVYVPFLAGFAILLTVPPDGPRRVVTFIATVVCSDVGGYAAGVFAGRHPMAPTVSPKKSWEGFAGSVVACVVAGVLFLTLWFHGAGTWWEGVLFGLAIAVAATLGDLGESMLKRDLGIKDMGHLLPGHGGIMDRLDSLLIAAPVAYLLLTAFVPPQH